MIRFDDGAHVGTQVRVTQHHDAGSVAIIISPASVGEFGTLTHKFAFIKGRKPFKLFKQSLVQIEQRLAMRFESCETADATRQFIRVAQEMGHNIPSLDLLEDVDRDAAKLAANLCKAVTL